MAKPGLAVVTGATGGIGSACAAKFAADGWPLLICDLDAGRLEAVAAPWRAGGATVETLAGDMAAEDYPERLVAAIGGRPIGAVVHTVGLTPTMADPARILTVNYDATVRLVEVVRPRIAAGSCAVLIASMSAYFVDSPEIDAAIASLEGPSSAALLPFAPSPQMAYPVSKRAVMKLAAREAAAFGARGARIASISPGIIDTAAARAEQAVSEQMNAMIGRTPLSRKGAPEEIAEVAAFLCSPAGSFVSGRDILVDGGLMASMGK
jgi:NAD(P)-dependent dehydrogenase (short-subunit alcohol dehydrogenase family)